MMSVNTTESKRLVLHAARDIADHLYDERNKLPGVSFWDDLEVCKTNTGGWSIEIAAVGDSSPRLEIWIDRYSGAGGNRFYAGLAAGTAVKIAPFVSVGTTSLRWKPVRTVTDKDIARRTRYMRLAEPLDARSYGKPIVEHFKTREHYFGVYDAIEPRDPLAHLRFCRLAEDFFLGVLSSPAMITTALDAVTDDDYPAIERQQVRWHIQFERSARLAGQRKRRDQYRCAVCGFQMQSLYGDLGVGYAEAHHKIPLSLLSKDTKTVLDDLLTVCPNCHRMLHRMEGRKNDWKKLQQIVKSQRQM